MSSITLRSLLQNSSRLLRCRPQSVNPSRKCKIERPSIMPHKDPQPLKNSPVSWKGLGVALGIGTVLYGGMLLLKNEKELKLEKERTKSLGKAMIGGPWTLVDHHGVTKSDTDYKGQWLFLYFGFVHCPDICPDELEKIIEIVDKIDENSRLPNLTPMFLSVDPYRDDVETVAEYVAEFSPKLVGLTGTEEQVKTAAKAYRVYFASGPKDDDNDYIVDHSVVAYLVNPEGDFVDYYSQNRTVDECYASVSAHMLKFRVNN